MFSAPFLLGCCVVAFIAAAGIAGFVRVLALRLGWMDEPTHRGSHERPTPSLGGISIVIVALTGLWIGFGSDPVLAGTLPIAVPALLAVAVVGLVDDLRPLPVTPRLVVQALACFSALLSVGGIGQLHVGPFVIEQTVVVMSVCFLAMVWFINLFNFMDGIDGIAATETIFISICAGVICASSGYSSLAIVWLVLAAGCAGFLCWNWEPARLFMGDVGSGFIGFFVALMFLLSIRSGALSVATALALTSVFVVDTTLTLLRRMLRGERWYEGHRTHAYQWLARKWGRHSRVTLAVAIVNLLLVLPVAGLTVIDPARSALWLGGLLGVVGVFAWVAGAGRPERIEE